VASDDRLKIDGARCRSSDFGEQSPHVGGLGCLAGCILYLVGTGTCRQVTLDACSLGFKGWLILPRETIYIRAARLEISCPRLGKSRRRPSRCRGKFADEVAGFGRVAGRCAGGGSRPVLSTRLAGLTSGRPHHPLVFRIHQSRSPQIEKSKKFRIPVHLSVACGVGGETARTPAC